MGMWCWQPYFYNRLAMWWTLHQPPSSSQDLFPGTHFSLHRPVEPWSTLCFQSTLLQNWMHDFVVILGIDGCASQLCYRGFPKIIFGARRKVDHPCSLMAESLKGITCHWVGWHPGQFRLCWSGRLNQCLNFCNACVLMKINIWPPDKHASCCAVMAAACN